MNMNTAIADLSTLGLDRAAIASRAFCLGGSDANIILSGEPSALLSLWEQKTGRKASDDLSDVLPVIMGSFTEPLNAAWFQKQTGLIVTDRGESATCPINDWRAATLDGKCADEDGTACIWEAKHVNPFGKPDEVVTRYMPQLHHNMAVCGVKRAILSMLRGNMDFQWFRVDYDEEYGAALLEAETAFWNAVLADEPPVAIEPPKAPTKPEELRTVSFEGSNEWASFAADYLENKKPAAKFKKAEKGLREMIDADVGTACGHGVEINRSKAGSLLIKEMKNAA